MMYLTLYSECMRVKMDKLALFGGEPTISTEFPRYNSLGKGD